MSIRIRNMLRERFNPQAEYTLTSEQALNLVCEIYERPRSLVLSHYNKTQVRVRLLAAMVAIVHTDEPFHLISATFERRDEKSIYRWMRNLLRMIKHAEFVSEFRYIQSQIGLASPKPVAKPEEPLRHLIRPPRVLPHDHPLTPERRACHMSNIAYASALHRAHGEYKRWE